LPLVRSSGPRATWPTAKPIRIAVTNSTSRHPSARKSSFRTIGATRAGGPFHVRPVRACALPRTERRDAVCSRRS
jgi:hypothetical protein